MERRSATLPDDQEVADPLLPVLLRDPADLSPAERTHDLVAAVARDDLLAVVLVLQNSYPEQVVATDAETGRTALETALQLPTRRDDIRRLITQCLLVCAPPGTALPAAPANLSSSASWQALQEWRTGGEQQASDAVQLCFDMTIGHVEDWITERELQVPDSLPPPPPPPLSSSEEEEAAPPPRTDEVERPASPPAAAAVVKTEPTVTKLPSPIQIKHEPSPLEDSTLPISSSSVPTAAQDRLPTAASPHLADPPPPMRPVATASPGPLGGGGPNRLEIRHLPLSITIVSLRDLVGGPSTRHISLDVSLENNEVTAIVETVSFETARAAVDRLRGYVYSDGSEERTLFAGLYAPVSQASTPVPVSAAAAVPIPRSQLPVPPPLPPPPAPLSSLALPPSCPPSPPRDSRFVSAAHPPPPPPSQTRGEPARQRGSPGERAAHDRRRSVSPRRRRRESSLDRPAYSSRRAGRSSSPAERTTQNPPALPWLYVTGISPRMCERALADILAREDIEAYDIRVDQSPVTYRRNDREERFATIGLTSPQNMTRARSVLDAFSIDGLCMHCRTYRDPRTNRLEPPSEEWRYPYVTHRSNLAHPPHPRACDIVVRGFDPARYLREAEIRELIESDCGDYTAISVKIDQKYATRVYIEMDRHSTALRAIEKLDGMIDRGHAITVNWDARPLRPRRAPSPPRNGFTSRPFRQYGDP